MVIQNKKNYIRISKRLVRISYLSKEQEQTLRGQVRTYKGYYDLFAFEYIENEINGTKTIYQDSPIIQKFLFQIFNNRSILSGNKVLVIIKKYFINWFNNTYHSNIADDALVLFSLDQAENPIDYQGYLYQLENAIKDGFSNRKCFDFIPHNYNIMFSLYRRKDKYNFFQHVTVSNSSYDLAHLFEENINKFEIVRNYDDILINLMLSLGMDRSYLKKLKDKNYEIIFLCDDLTVLTVLNTTSVLHDRFTFSNILLLDSNNNNIYNIDLFDLKAFLDDGIYKEYKYHNFSFEKHKFEMFVEIPYDHRDDSFFEYKEEAFEIFDKE